MDRVMEELSRRATSPGQRKEVLQKPSWGGDIEEVLGEDKKLVGRKPEGWHHGENVLLTFDEIAFVLILCSLYWAWWLSHAEQALKWLSHVGKTRDFKKAREVCWGKAGWFYILPSMVNRCWWWYLSWAVSLPGSSCSCKAK